VLRHRSSLGIGALVGLTLSASASALPPLSRPFGTEPPLPVQGTGSTNDPAVATDGVNKLVLFDDGRDIRGMLVDADGEPLFTEMATYGLSVTEGTGKYRARVAYGGGKYLAVWTDSVNGLEGLLIGADGLAEGEVFPIRTTAIEPTLVWVNDHFLLTTVELEDSGRNVAATIISADGDVGEPKLLTSDGLASQSSMALGPGGALISWIPNTDGTNLSLEAMIIDGDGEIVVAPFTITDGSFPSDASVKSSATGYLVTWGQYEGVRGATVSAEGEVSEVLEIANDSDLSTVTSGANAAGYTVVWQDYQDDGYQKTTLRHVSLDGQLGQETYVLDVGVYKPTLVANDDGYWYTVADTGLFGVFTDNDLNPTGDRQPLSLVQSSQYVSELVWNGAAYLMVFDDDRGGKYTYNARAMRFSTTGSRLEQRSLALDEPSESSSWYSAVSLGDGNALLGRATYEPRALSFQTLTSEGSLTPSVEQAALGSSGGVTLASFEGKVIAVYASTVAGQFLAQEFSAAGERVGEPRVLPLPETTYEVRVLEGAGGFVLQISDGTTTSLAALNADWTLGELQPVSNGTFPIDFVVGGGRTLAVWSIGATTRTARFWSDGAWDGQAVTLTDDGSWGDTTWDGTHFVAVWTDSTYHGHFTTIDTNGAVATSEPLFGDEECSGPTLASNGAGQTMLSCVRYNRDYSRRIVSYLIGEGADAVVDVPPPEESSDTDETTTSEASSGGDGVASEAPTSGAPESTAASEDSTGVTDTLVDATSSAAPSTSANDDPTTTTPDRGTPAPKASGCDVTRGSGGTNAGPVFGMLLALAGAVGARRKGRISCPNRL
jgi:hypothetical protein